MSNGGGTEWEQKRAVERMVIAMREGDADGMALALADYAAALGTRVTSSLGAIAAPLVEEIHGMRLDRSADARAADHKLDLLMQMTERGQQQLGRFEARIESIEERTLSTIITQADREQLIEWARGIPELRRRIEQLESDRYANR